MASVRKGATRIEDVPVEICKALSCGEIESVNLTECLSIDQAQLVHSVFPNLPSVALREILAASELGILKRMEAISTVLMNTLGEEGLEICKMHRSDTVRGWACFMIRGLSELNLTAMLELIRPLADDKHFGVREWAWMAIRPHLVRDLKCSIDHLAQWAVSPSEHLRRFSCESIRPRGVWCTHIGAFKLEPELAMPVLAPLRADPSIYVQDSVANWLNDAGKDQPEWVRSICSQWLHTTSTNATRRICHRALRNLK